MTDQAVAPAAPAESAPAEVQSQETPIAESHEDQPAPKADEPKGNPRLQKRFDELTRARYDAERRAAELEAQLARQQRQDQIQRQISEIEASKPRPDAFGSLVEYGDALVAHAKKSAMTEAMAAWQELQERSAAEQAVAINRQMAVQQQIERENTVLSDKFSSAVKEFPDFHKVVGNPDLPSVRGTPAYLAMLEADNFAKIAYHLAKTPGEFDRVFSIADPIRATREISRLDAQFSGNGATSAPPPPPSRSGSTVASKDPKDMTTEEWMRWREGELKKRPRR